MFVTSHNLKSLTGPFIMERDSCVPSVTMAGTKCNGLSAAGNRLILFSTLIRHLEQCKNACLTGRISSNHEAECLRCFNAEVSAYKNTNALFDHNNQIPDYSQPLSFGWYAFIGVKKEWSIAKTYEKMPAKGSAVLTKASDGLTKHPGGLAKHFRTASMSCYVTSIVCNTASMTCYTASLSGRTASMSGYIVSEHFRSETLDIRSISTHFIEVSPDIQYQTICTTDKSKCINNNQTNNRK